MSAAGTALQVLNWAAGEEMKPPGAIHGGSPPIPGGDLADAAELAAPPAPVRTAIGQLAAITTARLRLTAPPLRDSRPPGPAAGILAAAVSCRAESAAAMSALQAAASVGMLSAYDLAALHGVARHALRAGHFEQRTADLIRDLSPLTAALDHPSPSGEYVTENLLVSRVLPDRDGRDLAVRTFAEPTADPEQASWRADVLARRRLRDLPFVLDVYEAGLALFGREHQRRLRDAQSLLFGQPPDIAAARPLLQWWRALSEIERARPAEIRRRRLITTVYVEGVRAYRRFAAREAIAAWEQMRA